MKGILMFPRPGRHQEAKQIHNEIESECQNTGLDRLKRAFEKVGDFPKPVPLIGRPRLTKEEKWVRKLDREEENGILHITR